jgi:hypothetical protein
METTINFSFQVSKDTVENFRGTLPSKFETPQMLWEEIKRKSDLEHHELEETQLDVDYNGWSEKLTIDEIVNDPINEEYNIVFE